MPKNEWDENFFWIGKKSLLSVRTASIREDEVASLKNISTNNKEHTQNNNK